MSDHTKVSASNEKLIELLDALTNREILSDEHLASLKKILTTGPSREEFLKELRKIAGSFSENKDHIIESLINKINDISSMIDLDFMLGTSYNTDLLKIITNYETGKEEIEMFNDELKKYADALVSNEMEGVDSLDHMLVISKKDVRARERNLNVGYTLIDLRADVIASYLNSDYTVQEVESECKLDDEKRMSDSSNNVVLILNYL